MRFEQSKIDVHSHLCPVNPVGQVQDTRPENPMPRFDAQIPPLRHGVVWQWLITVYKKRKISTEINRCFKK